MINWIKNLFSDDGSLKISKVKTPICIYIKENDAWIRYVREDECGEDCDHPAKEPKEIEVSD